ncbi:MAG: class I SAM-dependent methyltransferase [Spirochaetaceae bacterium]|nr:MAG: class I SAM-dependent methyltransferase [Spirochaetaceae bacterium]
MDERRRFEGELADEYELIRLAYPDFDEFQRGLCDAIRAHAQAPTHVPAQASERPEASLVEIGTGNGFTTDLLLTDFPSMRITTIDNDPSMVRQARERFATDGAGAADATGEDATRERRTHRLSIVEADALEWLSRCDAASVDVVASAFTLHNMERDYRDAVEAQILRVLSPGGLFVNADKYAPDGQARFDALALQIERFFDAFVPLGKLDLLRSWVVHNIADQSPRFVMHERDSVDRLRSLGFESVDVSGRRNMQAILVATTAGRL